MTFEIIYHIMYHLRYIIIETRPFRAEVRKNQAWCRSVNNLSGQPLQQWRHLTKSFWCTCSTASTSSTVPTSRLLPLFPKMFKNHLTDELNLTRESVTKWLSCLVCCNKDLNVASSSRHYALPGLRINFISRLLVTFGSEMWETDWETFGEAVSSKMVYSWY